jgi:hypothetical protein
MNQSFKNIIPRLLRYSKQLDKVETFVDKSWLYLDNGGNNHEYYFIRDHRLIMSVNGKAVTGKWELLPNGKLLIDRVADQIVLKNQFIDEALMILQKSASDEDPFILIDEQKIPDLNVMKYLEEVEEKRIYYEKPLKTGTVEILPSGKIRFNMIEIGFSVYHHAGIIPSGNFDLGLKDSRRFMVVNNGVISELYYLVSYLDVKNQILEIRQPYSYLTSGSTLTNIEDLNIEFSKKLSIKETNNSNHYHVRINQSGKIVMLDNIEAFINFLLIVSFLVTIFIIFFVVRK